MEREGKRDRDSERERNGGLDGERQTDWGRRNSETAGEEGQTMAQHRFTANTETVLFHKPTEAESQRSDATHHLTAGQLHTCFASSPCSGSPMRPCDGADAEHSPRLSVLALRREPSRVLGNPETWTKARLWWLTDALLVCVSAFKLPSAVRTPNDKRWNKREAEHFHPTGPLPQPSAGASNQSCTSKALPPTDSAVTSRVVFTLFFFLSSSGCWVQSLRVIMVRVLWDYCLWAEVIMRW